MVAARSGETVPSRAVGDDEGVQSGLSFEAARTLEDVLEAWNLVYHAYRGLELVAPNDHEIHTTPQAASRHAAVFTGRIGGQVKTTLTAVHDSDLGLPLDTVYRRELDTLRADGRYLSETGLFADRRGGVGRSVGALLNLMRFAFYYALRHETASTVIGVHPHHVGFYTRLFAFEPLGELRSYAAVQGKPVVLLHLPLNERLSGDSATRGMTYFREHPLSEEEIADRYRFPDEDLQRPPLSAFRSSQTAH